MSYPDRAVKRCVHLFREGKVRPAVVRSVVEYKGVDVGPVEPFLSSRDPFVRRAACQIIGAVGNAALLVDVVDGEEDRGVIVESLKHLHRVGGDVHRVSHLLTHPDPAVQEAAIDMFRRAGRSDCLYMLLLDDDDHLVRRAKRFVEEHGEG